MFLLKNSFCLTCSLFTSLGDSKCCITNVNFHSKLPNNSMWLYRMTSNLTYTESLTTYMFIKHILRAFKI